MNYYLFVRGTVAAAQESPGLVSSDHITAGAEDGVNRRGTDGGVLLSMGPHAWWGVLFDERASS